MRIWHYKLIPYLPKSQLLAQWRELNSIFKKQDKHILINYIYEYENNKSDDLFDYTCIVINKMRKRKIKIKSYDNIFNYFEYSNAFIESYIYDFEGVSYELFKNHHTDRYLIQCFYNLQEKYDRGQKDFSKEIYDRLEEFVKIRKDKSE